MNSVIKRMVIVGSISRSPYMNEVPNLVEKGIFSNFFSPVIFSNSISRGCLINGCSFSKMLGKAIQMSSDSINIHQSFTNTNVSIYDTQFISCFHNSDGGAITIKGTSITLEIKACLFKKCNAGASGGGAIYSEGPSIKIEFSHFVQNYAFVGYSWVFSGKKITNNTCCIHCSSELESHGDGTWGITMIIDFPVFIMKGTNISKTHNANPEWACFLIREGACPLLKHNQIVSNTGTNMFKGDIITQKFIIEDSNLIGNQFSKFFATSNADIELSRCSLITNTFSNLCDNQRVYMNFCSLSSEDVNRNQCFVNSCIFLSTQHQSIEECDKPIRETFLSQKKPVFGFICSVFVAFFT